jgi:putative hydrolase of the HAD superfamily
VEIRAVLFDLDNTLFDHQASATAGLAEFLKHLGAEHSEDLTLSWFEIEQASYDRFLRREITFHEQRRERLRWFLPFARVAVPESDRMLDELFRIYLSNYQDAWTAFPDAFSALLGLREDRVPVSVVTNGNDDQQRAKIKKIGLEPLVDRIFTSELTGHAKPAPEAFLGPCKDLKVSPAQTLYVGDNYTVDIEGARNAGLQAVHLVRESSPPKGSIQGLAELRSILSRNRQV